MCVKLHMCVNLRTKFEVSSIILMSFGQEWGEGRGGGNFTPSPTSKRTPKKPTQIRVKLYFSKDFPIIEEFFILKETLSSRL